MGATTPRLATMGRTVKKANDITLKLGAYIGVTDGPLEQRKLDVERLFGNKIKADRTLDHALWSVMQTSLLQPTEDEPQLVLRTRAS